MTANRPARPGLLSPERLRVDAKNSDARGVMWPFLVDHNRSSFMAWIEDAHHWFGLLGIDIVIINSSIICIVAI